MENRRVHQRFNTALSVEIFTGSDVIPAQANNLSVGGLGIILEVPLTVQTQLGFSMFLVEEGIEDERTSPLNVQGLVCWCTQGEAGTYQAGIRFAPLGEEEQARVQLFLRRLHG
jgi:hypothetical protein